MPDEFQEQELREFIYLNDESINSHLSSLGVGLETNRTAANRDEEEFSGRFSAVVPSPFGGIGGSTTGRSAESEETERNVDITVPYRFQELIRQIKGKYDIKMPEQEDVEIGYGDVIAIEGVVSPLSVFRFEIAHDSNFTLQNSTIAAEKKMSDLRRVLEEMVYQKSLKNLNNRQKKT